MRAAPSTVATTGTTSAARYPVVPPRVDYELTPLGSTLHATIQSLVSWTEQHQAEIAAARAAYDRGAAERAKPGQARRGEAGDEASGRGR